MFPPCDHFVCRDVARSSGAARSNVDRRRAGRGGAHALWGVGSSWPFADRSALADAVAGTPEPPATRECFTVAALLLVAAGLVADVMPVGETTRRSGVLGVAVVLAGRGVAGVTGRTASIVPWTPSERFVSLDRRYYGPLCLLLAAGALRSARR